MILPTTCSQCGFGRAHICERSVCICQCHTPELRPERDPAAKAAVEATLRDIDAMSENVSTTYSVAA